MTELFSFIFSLIVTLRFLIFYSSVLYIFLPSFQYCAPTQLHFIFTSLIILKFLNTLHTTHYPTTHYPIVYRPMSLIISWPIILYSVVKFICSEWGTLSRAHFRVTWLRHIETSLMTYGSMSSRWYVEFSILFPPMNIHVYLGLVLPQGFPLVLEGFHPEVVLNAYRICKVKCEMVIVLL